MRNHQIAMTIGLAMVLCGLLWLGSGGAPIRIQFNRDPVFVVQNLSMVISGTLVLIAGRLAERRPRNAGFAVILGSILVIMSSGTSLIGLSPVIAAPAFLLGLAGFAAGLRCMSTTRAGDR